MVFKFFRRIVPRRTISLSPQTYATLWRLQGILNKPTASDLMEHLVANAAEQYGLQDITPHRDGENTADPKSGSSSNPAARSTKGRKLNIHDLIDGEAQYQDPSEVRFLTFKNSYLEHVPPTQAYVEGEWFDIKHWNKALFQAIRFLVKEEGVTTHDIADALHPNVKVGREDGLRPIEDLNLSYVDIRSPQVSWECIEKLNFFWNIDVRVRFRWSEKAKVELRGLSYEIRTLPNPKDEEAED